MNFLGLGTYGISIHRPRGGAEVKSLHFCTPKLVAFIKEIPIGGIFYSFRTGWITTIFPGDIIRCNERDDQKNETLLTYAFTIKAAPIHYNKLTADYYGGGSLWEMAREEITRYGRTFHPLHIFIQLGFQKLGEVEG